MKGGKTHFVIPGSIDEQNRNSSKFTDKVYWYTLNHREG